MSKIIVCDWDTVNQCDNCSYIPICELNPTRSRYKDKLDSEREMIREKQEEVIVVKEGDIVVCSKKNCSQFGMYDLCRHGVPHEYSGSCMMRCERFTDAHCDIGGIGL